MTRIIVLFIAVVAFLLSCSGNCAVAGPLDNLSRDEKIVTITILAEAGGEGDVGMQAVACVIQQRSIERHKSVSAICLQRKQFSCWNGTDTATLGARMTRHASQNTIGVAIGLAKDLVAKKSLDRRLVGYANHYHTLDVHPEWSEDETPTAVIGHHKFFKL